MIALKVVSKIFVIAFFSVLSCVCCVLAEKQSEEELPPPSGASVFSGAGANGEPTYIKSDSLHLQIKERAFTYAGNVEVMQGDMVLTANRLEGHYDENNRIEELVATGNVVIVRGEEVRATSEKAVYNQEKETLTLTVNPELQQEGSVLSADRIIIFLLEERSTAEGAVRVRIADLGDKKRAGAGR